MSSLMFKIMKASATFHGVGYNEKKQKQGLAKLIHFKNFGHLHLGKETISKEAFTKYLEQYSKRNDRIKKPQFHAVLSCKGNLFSHAELKDHAFEIMDRLGYAGNPTLIYEHRDTANNHIHIISSRVDGEGKKINHVFEGKRANQIVNNILNVDPKQEFDKAIQTAWDYNITTTSQLNLLMENSGYDYKINNDNIVFYKHGAAQGSVEKCQLENKIDLDAKSRKLPVFIKAIIYKYQKQYPGTLFLKNDSIHTTEKRKFESQLTNLLRSQLGFEFVFFAGKGQEKPYGYTLIDHKNKIVYKGSEIIKLEQLTCTKQTTQEVNKQNNNSIPPKLTLKNTIETTNTPSSASTEILQTGTTIEDIITDTQKQVEHDLNRAGGKGRRSKKRRDFL